MVFGLFLEVLVAELESQKEVFRGGALAITFVQQSLLEVFEVLCFCQGLSIKLSLAKSEEATVLQPSLPRYNIHGHN